MNKNQIGFLARIYLAFKPKPTIYIKAPTSKKVGRNEYCPCGSGKKYKKCCLIKKQVGILGLLYLLISKYYAKFH